MELKIKTHHALPCRTEVFTINGKSAEQNDFGDMYDHHYEDAEPYAWPICTLTQSLQQRKY